MCVFWDPGFKDLEGHQQEARDMMLLGRADLLIWSLLMTIDSLTVEY